MKKLLKTILAAFFAVALFSSCTEKNIIGEDTVTVVQPLSIAPVPDYADGSVGVGDGIIKFEVLPLPLIDSLVGKKDLSIFSFDIVTQMTKGDSPSIEVKGASVTDGLLVLEVGFKGMDSGKNHYAASLRIEAGDRSNISRYFTLRFGEE